MLALCLLAIGLVLSSLPSEAGGLTHDYRDAVKQYDGMTEDGYNRGPFIDAANAEAYVPYGSPYCASAVRKILRTCNLTTDTKMTARAKDYIGAHSIRATDVFVGRAKVPEHCVGVMTRKGGGHIYFKISLRGDRLRRFDFNSTPDGKRGSQYDGRWSGYKVCSLRQTCSPLNSFRTIAFTRVRDRI
jgi:hypothetical protein